MMGDSLAGWMDILRMHATEDKISGKKEDFNRRKSGGRPLQRTISSWYFSVNQKSMRRHFCLVFKCTYYRPTQGFLTQVQLGIALLSSWCPLMQWDIAPAVSRSEQVSCGCLLHEFEFSHMHHSTDSVLPYHRLQCWIKRLYSSIGHLRLESRVNWSVLE